MSIHKILMALMVAIAATAFTACSSDADDNNGNNGQGTVVVNVNCNKNDKNPYTRGLEFPRLHQGNDTVISHTTLENGRTTLNYSYEWAIDKRSQRWACYAMTKDYTGNAGRYEGGYPYDPQLPSRYYFDHDPFTRSGYDHGHICPSADRQYSYEANKQTFYLPNMQPQIHIFNASMWGDMENRVRKWVPTNSTDTLFVCRGGTIDSEENIIKRINGELIVPKYFFMAMLLKKWNTAKREYEYQAIGFWIEHMSQKPKNYDSKDYVVTIDELERKTGIDFFCNLPDDIENKVEAVTYPQSWSWK